METILLIATHADLQAHADSVAPEIGSQVGGYLKTLEERYEMVEKRLPVFAKPKARRGHYTMRDNFLHSWLDALALPTAAIQRRWDDQSGTPHLPPCKSAVN